MIRSKESERKLAEEIKEEEKQVSPEKYAINTGINRIEVGYYGDMKR